MKKFNLLLLVLILPFIAVAQVRLKGIVKDDVGPVPYANVILIDSVKAIKMGVVTDNNGAFTISPVKGKYRVTISFMGYKSWVKELQIENDLDLGDIRLAAEASRLNEVVVKGNRKIIEQKIDRLVYNVENNVSTAGGHALDALRVAPGIMVQSNSISMLGKGSSRVMVDGRMIELTGEDLLNYLHSIPSGDIKNIEIITNPPAKYEAGGDGGIININLKKGAMDSWKNTTTLAYDRNAFNAGTLRNNFLYNKGRVRFSIGAGARTGYSQTKENLDAYYPGGLWELGNNGKQKEDNVNGRVTLDYNVSDRTTLGLQYMGNYNNPDRNDLTTIKIHNVNNGIDSLLINKGFNDLGSQSHTYNAHLISKLDTLDRTISFDVDYFKFNSKTDNNFVATTYLPDMQFLNVNQSARNASNQNIDNFSIKADMDHPLKFVDLSYGTRFSFVNSKGDIQYYNTITGSQVLDPNRSNGFEYTEKNQAFYINGSKKISSRLSLQLGLRLENTQTDGYSRTLNQQNKNQYLKLFPTFYVSYKQDEQNSFLFNYGRRINRPGFRSLNPFRSYINSNSYSEGNPFLQPSFSDNFDFTYNYKGKLRTNIFFNITNDGFGVIFTSNPQTNTQIITRENYYREYYYGIGETYTTNLTSWWQHQSLIYFLDSKTKFVNGINAQPINSPQLYLSTNNTFSLAEFTKLQVDFFYSSPFERGLYKAGYRSGLNLGLRQGLLKDNLQLSLLMNDVFNTAYTRNNVSIVNGIKQVYSENNSSRFFRFSLTYNFGNNKVNVKQRNFGNEEEKRRSEN